MASIKVKFRNSTVTDQPGSIYYQFTHQRRVKNIPTSYKIFPDEWDASTASVKFPSKCVRKPRLKSIQENINSDILRLRRISLHLSLKTTNFDIEELIMEYERISQSQSVFNYLRNRIDYFKEIGKIRTSETYKCALNSFQRFRENEDIQFDSLSSEVLEAYEAFLKLRGLVGNSISFYMRILRATYNRAVEEGITEQRHPFKRVYTGNDRTKKRSVNINIIKKINDADLTLKSQEAYARDMFMMSFFLRGMSFIDMAYLRKKDLENEVVVYRRRKTGQYLSIKWTKEMLRILERYPENPTIYLLPIITQPDVNTHTQYRRKHCEVNKGLKKVASKLDLKLSLTTYVARHSWASIARSKGIPLSVISEGLGHDNETTTKIYLSSLDSSEVDNANDLILHSL